MQRVRIVGLALVAILAISALAASAASAKSAKLNLTYNFNELQLKPGQEFNMANETAINIETNLGTISCKAAFYPGEQGFTGTDETNDEKTDKIEIKGTYGTWSAGSCSTTTALGSTAFVEAFGSSNPIGTLNLGSNLKAELKTKSASDPVYIYLGFSGGETCYLDFSKLKGTISANEETGFKRMIVNFNKQKLKFYKPASGKLCPKKATITAPFAYQLTTEAYYVFYELLS